MSTNAIPVLYLAYFYIYNVLYIVHVKTLW